MKPVILYTCDIWKSWSSARVYGVFTNRKKLNRHLQQLLHQGSIELMGQPGKSVPIHQYTIPEIHNRMNGIILQEIELNQNI